MAGSEQMSKRERVEAAMARQPTDRVPVYDMLRENILAMLEVAWHSARR